jgi:CheY-like chemotaxis protein
VKLTTDGPLRILLVEDEAMNRALLRASLARSRDSRVKQAVVTEAGSLNSARELAGQAEYDLLLLDRRLPDGDGFDLARELQDTSAVSRPVIVALTADAVPATRSAAVEAGCAAVLTKPFRPLELIALIEGMLDEA